jgi:hypothetical protein
LTIGRHCGILKLWRAIRPSQSLRTFALDWKLQGWTCWRCSVHWIGMDLTPAEIPRRLIRQLFELDAD